MQTKYSFYECSEVSDGEAKEEDSTKDIFNLRFCTFVGVIRLQWVP